MNNLQTLQFFGRKNCVSDAFLAKLSAFTKTSTFQSSFNNVVNIIGTQYNRRVGRLGLIWQRFLAPVASWESLVFDGIEDSGVDRNAWKHVVSKELKFKFTVFKERAHTGLLNPFLCSFEPDIWRITSQGLEICCSDIYKTYVLLCDHSHKL